MNVVKGTKKQIKKDERPYLAGIRVIDTTGGAVSPRTTLVTGEKRADSGERGSRGGWSLVGKSLKGNERLNVSDLVIHRPREMAVRVRIRII
jgi:hypothetical protein